MKEVRERIKHKEDGASNTEFGDVTICLEGLADVVAFYWLTSMVENNP